MTGATTSDYALGRPRVAKKPSTRTSATRAAIATAVVSVRATSMDKRPERPKTVANEGNLPQVRESSPALPSNAVSRANCCAGGADEMPVCERLTVTAVDVRLVLRAAAVVIGLPFCGSTNLSSSNMDRLHGKFPTTSRDEA
jgi:hypothetical protein